MSLTIDDLTKDDDFFNGAPIGATVVGSGQMIYFKQCTIEVYKSGAERRPIEKISKRDGQAFVRKGISLLLEEGPVKEE